MHIHVVAEEHFEGLLEERGRLKKMLRNYRKLSNALNETGDKVLILTEPYLNPDPHFSNPKHRIVARLGKLAETAHILPMDNPVWRDQNAAQGDIMEDLASRIRKAQSEEAKRELQSLENIKVDEFLMTADRRSEIMARNIVKALELVKKYPELWGVKRIVAIVGAEHAPEVLWHIAEMLGDRIGKTVYLHKNVVEPGFLKKKGDIVLHIHDVTADQKVYRQYVKD